MKGKHLARAFNEAEQACLQLTAHLVGESSSERFDGKSCAASQRGSCPGGWSRRRYDHQVIGMNLHLLKSWRDVLTGPQASAGKFSFQAVDHFRGGDDESAHPPHGCKEQLTMVDHSQGEGALKLSSFLPGLKVAQHEFTVHLLNDHAHGGGYCSRCFVKETGGFFQPGIFSSDVSTGQPGNVDITEKQVLFPSPSRMRGDANAIRPGR